MYNNRIITLYNQACTYVYFYVNTSSPAHISTTKFLFLHGFNIGPFGSLVVVATTSSVGRCQITADLSADVVLLLQVVEFNGDKTRRDA